VESADETHFVLRGEKIRWEEIPGPVTAIPEFKPYESGPAAEIEVVRKVRERKFAATVRWAYHEKCSLCEIGFRLRGRPLALDAAHIIPAEERGTSLDVRNGLLLCKNHHALFDQYAWVPDEDYRVLVSPEREFRSTAMANHLLKLEGRRLPNLPSNPANLPAIEAIQYRLDKFR